MSDIGQQSDPHRPVRIAVVRQAFTCGGAALFSTKLGSSLVRSGASVTFLTRATDRGEWGAPGLRVDPFHIGRTWRDWSFARAVRKQITQAGFDLVQSHTRVPGCDIYRAGDGVHREWLRHRSRACGPLRRLFARLSPYHHYLKGVEARVFCDPRLRAVICNSRMVRDDILRHYSIAPAKLHVIDNGVDTERFRPADDALRRQRRDELGLDPERPILLFVGSGFWRKGLDQTLAAAAGLDSKPLVVVVGRDCKQRRRYDKRIRELGLADRVDFRGIRSDVVPYYQAADIFCLPSLYDPCPNAVMEAMSCGLPVVISSTTGAVDFVETGVSGLVCDAGDVAAMRRCLGILEDQETRAGMGRAARRSMESVTVERMTTRMLDLYAALLAE